MEYNPSNLVFTEWLGSNFYNHLEMDWYSKNALRVYWMRGDDEVILSNKEVSDLKDENNDYEHKITEIFMIETNLFDYETMLCTKFNEFNYLLKVDTKLFTHDVKRTYEDYKNEWNNEVDEPWSKDGVPYELCDHIYECFCIKNGKTKWPTCNSNEDGFYNGGELPGMVRVVNDLYYKDYEFYDDLPNIRPHHLIVISQSPRGIFINQSNYALEIIKKYGMLSSDPIDTPMVDKSKLDKDLQGKPAKPKKAPNQQLSEFSTEKDIDMGLWYSKDSCITLTAYQMQTTPGVKILDKSHLEVHNSWEINLLASHPKSKRALLSPVQRRNILLYLGVVLKSYG
ncbi:hypothetical protein Tco_0997020 [Tanacetum coccineum]